MLLISIHPFAFRRLILVIVAVAGFSALCLADPVLMARRYNPQTRTIGFPPAQERQTFSARQWEFSPTLDDGNEAEAGTKVGEASKPGREQFHRVCLRGPAPGFKWLAGSGLMPAWAGAGPN